MPVLTQLKAEKLSKLLLNNVGKPYESLQSSIDEVLRPKDSEVDRLLDEYTQMLMNPILDIKVEQVRECLETLLKNYTKSLYNHIYNSAYNDHCDISVYNIENILGEMGMEDYE